MSGNTAEATPLMKQYHALKARHPEDLLFFRLGDFYELFGEDAVRASPILEVVLTHRQGVPMCGVPAHALDSYAAKCLRAGLRLAIADQTEDPAAAKGLVKRDVVRIMTPGTLQEEALLSARQSNYLGALALTDDAIGLSVIESSTGEFRATEFRGPARLARAWDELSRLSPSEVVAAKADVEHELLKRLRRLGIAVAEVPAPEFSGALAAERLNARFGTASVGGFGLRDQPAALAAAGAALRYLEHTRCGGALTLEPVRTYSLEDHLQIDASTLDHLDLIGPSAPGHAPRTLLDILDSTLTPMGGRLLRRWISAPLRTLPAIRARQDQVALELEHKERRRSLRAILQGWPDTERILSRLASGTILPRDLSGLSAALARAPRLAALLGDFPVLPDLASRLSAAIVETPPAGWKDGGVIREGFHPELDEVRRWISEGKSRLLELEARERQAAGIPTLKVGFNSVFGYYLEVTKTHLAKVPAHFIRKQTTANGERFITPELKEYESRILGAEERALRLESSIAQDLRREILAHEAALRTFAQTVAERDVFQSLAEVAERRRYVRPLVEESDALMIRAGRHPVIEAVLPAGAFVPNDAQFHPDGRQIMILTGPNMSGKSTYLRQVALTVVMAQMGSFVPAAEARIGIVDQLFTRIGAADRLMEGESTFMVEMVETARILNHATAKSLVILDEVGRGTSTYDGISIAWACLEYLHGRREKREEGTERSPSSLLTLPSSTIGPKVLFATHYFELTRLADELPGVFNAHVTAREQGDHVVFLHRVEDGPADRSYGIHVARLAGVPRSIIARATVLLEQLEKGTIDPSSAAKPAQQELF